MKAVTFINTNRQVVYVEDPNFSDEKTAENGGLRKLRSGEEVKTSDEAFAAALDATGGVVTTTSPEGKEFNSKAARELRELHDAAPGPAAWPAVDDPDAERSGLHITGKDSGMPVASDVEPGDVKDGSGEDRYEGVAAVENGEVTRGDVPKAVAEAPTQVSGDGSAGEEADLSKLSVKKLKALAKERNVDVTGTGKKGSIKKSDLVSALSTANPEGAVGLQHTEPSKTEPSESVASPESTGTLTSDKTPRKK